MGRKSDRTAEALVRWQSRGGSYWLELYAGPFGYSYSAENGGGYLGENLTFADAMAEMEKQIVVHALDNITLKRV